MCRSVTRDQRTCQHNARIPTSTSSAVRIAQYRTGIGRLGRFTKYEGLAHTRESNFEKCPRTVTVLSVHYRIIVVPNRASHPLSLCCGKDTAVLLKFHKYIGDVGIPTDKVKPDRH